MVYKNFSDVLADLIEAAPTEPVQNILHSIKEQLSGYSPTHFYRAIAAALVRNDLETPEEKMYLSTAAEQLIRKADSLARNGS